MKQIAQLTEEWFDVKRGKVSATNMASILMKPTTAGYRNYLIRLALERITGTTEETYSSPDMLRGVELEPIARACYEFESDCEVGLIGWADHPTIPMAGCSPDGLVMVAGRLVGGVEFKCPKPATHVDYLLLEKIDRDYLLQMQWQMACQPDLPWVDFCSYCPAFPESKQLKIIRFERDPKMIQELEDAAVKFNRMVDQMVKEIEAI